MALSFAVCRVFSCRAAARKTAQIAFHGHDISVDDDKPDLEKYPSGRRGSPAKGVGRVERREGSNPSFSAKLKPLTHNESRVFPFSINGLRSSPCITPPTLRTPKKTRKTSKRHTQGTRPTPSQPRPPTHIKKLSENPQKPLDKYAQFFYFHALMPFSWISAINEDRSSSVGRSIIPTAVK